MLILSFVFLFPSGKMASNDSNITDEIMEKVHVSVIDLIQSGIPLRCNARVWGGKGSTARGCAMSNRPRGIRTIPPLFEFHGRKQSFSPKMRSNNQPPKKKKQASLAAIILYFKIGLDFFRFNVCVFMAHKNVHRRAKKKASAERCNLS